MTDNALTQANEVAGLWAEYQASKKPELREKLIEKYLPLVKMVAGRVAIGLPQHIDKEDLISYGFFGLLDAIERFDPSRNIKFETYAVARIRGSIFDAIRVQDWLPASLRQKGRLLERTIAELENSLGRSATDVEIAQAMNFTVEQLHQLINQLNASTLVPLEEFVQNETVNQASPNLAQEIEQEEVKNTLAKAIDRLPEKERLVISLYYYEGLTLKEISLVLKLSEARISQLHTKAIFRLRGALSRLKSSLL
ncbi:FliA/WhiG family RNA polymerase sigma factor [Sporolituus thermophilus]|uniref:RNA polymerase sigma factor n=1 Tax=Sporolituus thermophilus DSM 23256 TaxID=1123285 RepID=A0A1G7KQM4_9FIRM|nr:FliA/WhiG family RNA polymerase sigma factor [Sporolituus thermophilus]SDF39538.1 RNA polymerase, sigma 28 subunit, SigD/FliA/WhiG [Sporolituus thermophilus DSM 23256]